jgi:hypothetical protein
MLVDNLHHARNLPFYSPNPPFMLQTRFNKEDQPGGKLWLKSESNLVIKVGGSMMCRVFYQGEPYPITNPVNWLITQAFLQERNS